MLTTLTDSSVSEADLQHARTLIAAFARTPENAGMSGLPHDQQTALSLYATALSDVGALLRDRTGTPPPWDQSRPDLPASMRGFAIAEVGFLSRMTIDDECPRHGFVKSGTAYVHEDGSWANVVLGMTVEIGWKGYSLADLGGLYGGASGWH
jgi:hypothetical protein